MPDLPYFDLLIDDRPSRGELSQLWEDQVHWGYWETPSSADGTLADYIAAMERMNGVLLRPEGLPTGKGCWMSAVDSAGPSDRSMRRIPTWISLA